MIETVASGKVFMGNYECEMRKTFASFEELKRFNYG